MAFLKSVSKIGRGKKGGGKKGGGGPLFHKQGESVKGKSKLSEDPDLLAGDSPQRKVADKIERQSMVDDPNYPKMKEVGQQGEQVNVGGQRYLNAVSNRRKINEKSVKAAQKDQKNLSKEIEDIQSKIKEFERLNVGVGQKAATAKIAKLKDQLKSKKDMLQIAKNKEKISSGKLRKSPRIARTNMKTGGKISKKGGGKIKTTYRSGGGLVSKKKTMYGYKEGGQV